jgi:hypothetical protein
MAIEPATNARARSLHLNRPTRLRPPQASESAARVVRVCAKPRSWDLQAASVAIADLNGDGRRDLALANANALRVVVLLAGRSRVCVVPNVKGRRLPAARLAVARADCRLGRIRRDYSRRVKEGRVIVENPPPRRVLRAGGKVNLVLSRGRRR